MSPAGKKLLADLERIKWLPWHGNRHRAGQTIGFFLVDVDGLEVDYPNLRKFARAAQEFSVYITVKQRAKLSRFWSAPLWVDRIKPAF